MSKSSDLLRASSSMHRSLEALRPLEEAQRAFGQLAVTQQKAIEAALRPALEVQRMIELMLPKLDMEPILSASMPMLDTSAILRALQPTLHLQRSLQPFLQTLTESTKLALHSWNERHLEVIRRSVEALSVPASFIGEFEYEPPEEELEESELREELEHDSKLILPDAAHERLLLVEFIPIRVLEAVSREPNLMYQLASREFESLIAQLLERFGFENILLTPKANDGGRDIVATKRINSIPILFAFECKRYRRSHKVGVETVRALLGTISRPETQANIGVLVTTSEFTKGAKKLILSEARIDGRNFDGLVEWLSDYRVRSARTVRPT